MNKYMQLKDKSHLLFPFFSFFLLIGAIVLVSFQNQTRQSINSKAASNVVNCEVPGSDLTISTNEQSLLTLVNEYRSQNNAGPLAFNDLLNRAASWMSNDLAAGNRQGHTDSLGRSIAPRFKDCGYTAYQNIGENLFYGSSSPQEAISWWKNSPSHNETMLNPIFTEVGIAEKGGKYTMDFGRPLQVVDPSITLEPSLSVTGVPNASVSATPTPEVRPTVDPQQPATKVKVSIEFNGIGRAGNSSPINLSRQVALQVLDLENKEVTTAVAFLTYNQQKGFFAGDVNLGKIANGTYYMKVFSEFTLISLVLPQFQVLDYTKTLELPTVLLYPGDFDQDNALTIDDYTLALACFQDAVCSAEEKAVDLNDDGIADIKDYNLLLDSYNSLSGD